MFPCEGMPAPAQWLSQALPLTHFLKIIRGIALRGAGFDDLRGELLRLAVILAALVTLSSLRFRKNLA
jgi:ABC-2 type transport system permease protein